MHSMGSDEDPYALLSVSRTVNADQLKRAYRQLSMAWHPDRHTNGSEAQQREAERRFKLINAAYVAVGEILRAKEATSSASGQAAVVQRSDARVEAIRSVVNSVALRLVPNLPRHAYRRVIGVVEQLLLDTIAVGERAFVQGFDGAFRDAMVVIGMDATLRGDALKVLDAAADELQWRGKGADPQTWQQLLRPLEHARGRTSTPAPSPRAKPRQTARHIAWEDLLRPEPLLVMCQGALGFLVLLLLLPMVPLDGTVRAMLLLCDLLALGYLTFGPRRV
jgi:DnaJ-domain-containing protein 1